MITVIATGFDTARKREPARRESAASLPYDVLSRPVPREANFLAELDQGYRMRGAPNTNDLRQAGGIEPEQQP